VTAIRNVAPFFGDISWHFLEIDRVIGVHRVAEFDVEKPRQRRDFIRIALDHAAMHFLLRALLSAVIGGQRESFKEFGI
jgi:hypothetical protein